MKAPPARPVEAVSPQEGSERDLANQRRLALCAGVVPLWEKQLRESRQQSESAIRSMMGAFANLRPHLDRAEAQSTHIARALGPQGETTHSLAQVARQIEQVMRTEPALPLGVLAVLQQTLSALVGAAEKLEAVALPLEQETHTLSDLVESMMVGFQFQDRVSQMLGVVQDDMARMRQTLGDHEAPLEALPDWLARLEGHYTTDQQRQIHHGDGVGSANDPSETTYF